MVLTLLGQIDDLQGQLYYLKRQLFGKKSEKLNPAQRLLFENLYDEVKAKLEEQKQSKPEVVKNRKNENHKGRNPLPADLKREIIPIEPSEEEKFCDIHNKPKKFIGTEKTEKLEYVPASFFVKVYERAKYACDECQGNISIGELPPMVVDKGLACEGLLAHIITSKYCDHAPLNRLEGIFKRSGVDINVSTMCDWVGKCSDLLEPLVKRMHQKILESPKINSDDTSIPVKNPNRKGSTYNGYLWVYIDNKKNVVFDFTPTRSREGPIKFLGKYCGKLQADAYNGYNEYFMTSGATEIGCHAHARRKFEYAVDSDPVRAARLMVLLGRLYEIEKRAKEEEYNSDKLLEVRQKEAKPILNEIKAVFNEYKDCVLPKSPMGKAITYSLNQWEALLRYLEDPTLSIDNNISERVLRMVVIRRLNYMFAGSEAGARRAANIYSLVASCKLNEIDPFAYFRDVLVRISTHPADKIDDLLPSNWKKPEKTADKAAA
ncbi:MAG: IS66 family transposase [Planctomycetaceae bacterium]|nr:IS66 family transposase [Planctomycetaceae bacterium]